MDQRLMKKASETARPLQCPNCKCVHDFAFVEDRGTYSVYRGNGCYTLKEIKKDSPLE